MRNILIVIGFLMCQALSSQVKVDTMTVIYDSLRYYSFVITEHTLNQNIRRETRYFVSTVDQIKNKYFNILGGLPSRKESYRMDSVRYWNEKSIYDTKYKCRTQSDNIIFPENTYFYLRVAYLNMNCDSIPIFEGLFYNGHFLDLYNAGIYKEYDLKGMLLKEGWFYFSKIGARGVLLDTSGVKFGPVPRKFKRESYGGEFIRGKQDGIWKFYKGGKLISTVQYKKGRKVNKTGFFN